MDWYRGTLTSRFNDKRTGALIAVIQRLHQEDLAGASIDAGGWAQLDLPAIAQENETVPIGPNTVFRRRAGEALQPQREPLEVLEQLKKEIGTFNFNAQYLQRPVPAEGNLVKWSWFRVYAQRPAHDAHGRIVQSWDTAQKPTDDADYSVCTTWLWKDDLCFLLDVHPERLDYPSLKRRVIELHHRFAAHHVLIEDASSGIQLIQELLYGRPKSGVRPIAIPPERDKQTRMAVAASMIEEGRVILPEEGPLAR